MRLLLSLVVLFSTQVFAEIKTFKLKNSAIKIDLPKSWIDSEKLLSSEVTLVGPMNLSNRPVVIINATEAEGLSFDDKSLKKNQNEYEEGRKEWVKKYKGKVLKFFPYETVKKGSLTSHVIGFSYSINDVDFISKSHYFTCGKNLYQFKTLTLVKETKVNEVQFNKILSSFSCL